MQHVTVPRETWDAVREALKHGIREMNLSGKAKECMPLHHALAAANAVSHPKPENAPVTDGGAITSESAANAVSEQPKVIQVMGFNVVLDSTMAPSEMKMVQPLKVTDLGRYALEPQAQGEIDALRQALVYVAHASHATPLNMLPKGVMLCDGDGVVVRVPNGPEVWGGNVSDYEKRRLASHPQATEPASCHQTGVCVRSGLAAENHARLIECARRLVEHADFNLGGILSADSKAKDIPSKAVSQVKSRHLAALRDALPAAPEAKQ